MLTSTQCQALETYQIPEFLQKIYAMHSLNTDKDYFPYGVDSFIFDTTEILKATIREEVAKLRF